MQFRFNGDQQMLLTQYFDEATDRPLLVDPGGVYEMRPAGTWVVPVPPQDGRWELVEPAPPEPPPATVVTLPGPAPVVSPPDPAPDVAAAESPAEPV